MVGERFAAALWPGRDPIGCSFTYLKEQFHVIGTVAAWSLRRALQSLQYGVSTSDPVSWTIVLSVLGLTALAASWRPAREAVRADPLLLLRED